MSAIARSAQFSTIGAEGAPRLGIAGQFARLLPVGWRLLRDSKAADEVVLATDGRVALRSIPGRVIACTAVKGPPGTSLQTGLLRLADYAEGRNLAREGVRTARPVVQRPISSGRWLVEIALPGIDDPTSVPRPCNPKVRLRTVPAETIAVVRVPGQPGARSLARAEATLQVEMAVRGWFATGPAMLRLCGPFALLPLLGTMELALPVAAG